MDSHEQGAEASMADPRITSRNEGAQEMWSIIEGCNPVLRRALFETALEAAIAEETQAAGKRPSANSIRLARKMGRMMAAEKEIPGLLTDEAEVADERI